MRLQGQPTPSRGRRARFLALAGAATLFASALTAPAALAQPYRDTAEALLAHIVLSEQQGDPDYASMEPAMADAIRPQAAALQQKLNALGPIVAMFPEGVRDNGQLFLVQHANGVARWQIFRGPDGRLSGLWYWVLGTEEAILARMIDTMRRGVPDYARMEPAMEAAIRPQEASLAQKLSKLGPVVQVTRETSENYLVRHASGDFARWRLYLSPAKKVTGLWYDIYTPQQIAQQQKQQKKKSGGSGLFGALIGVGVGAAASAAYGLDTTQTIGAMMKATQVASPGSAIAGALGSTGETLMTGGNAGTAVTGGLASASGSSGASYPTKPNLATGACAGFTESNYRDKALQGGGDAQLYTMCGQAFEYYTMYKRAIAQGYSEADANRTYAAHEQSARVASGFLQSHGAN